MFIKIITKRAKPLSTCIIRMQRYNFSCTGKNVDMIGQSKIFSFFNPSQKRKCSDEQNPPPKKKHISEEEPSEKTEKCSSPTTDIQLSPEQKQRIEENRFKAKARLYEKQTNGLLVNFGQSWFKALESEFAKPYFIQLSKFVADERQKKTIYPTPDNVFSWTRACDIKDIKVVILGQDPYHGPRQAHGLSFSVLPGIPPPPSLVNMYKELQNDVKGFTKPTHGYLQGWANQGVLMLNACLTVRASEANSHKDKGWEKFTDATISWFNKNRHGLIFILWGSYAQKKGAHIDKKKHHVLTGVHPSPLSAHRGFFGCKHFSKCNDLLKKEGKAPIDWSNLPLS